MTVFVPLTFPGAIYDATGNDLNGGPKLHQDQIDACLHRSTVSKRSGAPIARVWLLADDASHKAIPIDTLIEAVELVLAWRSILILARRPEVEVDVRTGLLHTLDLVTAPLEEGGRA